MGLPTEKMLTLRRLYHLDHGRTFKGIRRWFNLETKDLSQAIERKQELLDSPSLARHDSLEIDCARFVNWKLARREYTSGSAEKARHVLKVFSSRFGAGATLQTIRTSDIQKWYDGPRGLKESTAESYIMVVRALFRWAVEVERCRVRMPARDVRIVIPSRVGRRDWPDKERIAGVLKAAANDDLLFILLSGIDAGLRRNEIVEARVSWFDLRNGLLHVRKTPRHSAVSEPCDSDLVYVVKRHRIVWVDGSELVFEQQPVEKLGVLDHRGSGFTPDRKLRRLHNLGIPRHVMERLKDWGLHQVSLTPFVAG
jgi:integrase